MTADEELDHWMRSYQEGHLHAFEQLYAALAPPLSRFLRRLAPPGIEPDDLVQTTFLQLHRARATYLTGQPVRPWAYAIARHVALMARRGRARTAGREASIDEQALEIAAPESGMLGALDRIALERALGMLSDPGREALWLHHIAGLSFREVAAVQGIGESAAKVRAHRALSSLRAHYATGGPS